MAMPLGIQGQTLEITVVGCNKLRDTEWISRQDPYVCLEYASTKLRSRTCTDGGKNPTFNEKFVISLIEGLREINVAVWNSNTLTMDDFIGSGKIQLHKVISQGYDDSTWSLQSKRGKYAGEVRAIMHYANAQNPVGSHVPTAPHYGSTPPPHYGAAPSYAPPYAPPISYPSSGYPTPPPAYPSYPMMPTPYAPPSYPPPQVSAYPPHPPVPYPHQHQPYPPPTQSYYPPASYPGIYPPPPY